MHAEELSVRYERALQRGPAGLPPTFEVLWRAFVELAAEPVVDLYRPDSEDDELEIDISLDPESGTPAVGLRRQLIVSETTMVVFYVAASFPGKALGAGGWVLGVGGSPEGAAEFVTAAEQLPAFEAIGLETTPASVTITQDRDE
jgi:hypothetical protein